MNDEAMGYLIAFFVTNLLWITAIVLFVRSNRRIDKEIETKLFDELSDKESILNEREKILDEYRDTLDLRQKAVMELISETEGRFGSDTSTEKAEKMLAEYLIRMMTSLKKSLKN